MSEGAAGGVRTTRERLYTTIEDVLGLGRGTVDERLAPDTVSAWDSLNHLTLVLAIESEFGVSFTPEDVMDMRNVGLVQTILREHGVEVEDA